MQRLIVRCSVKIPTLLLSCTPHRAAAYFTFLFFIIHVYNLSFAEIKCCSYAKFKKLHVLITLWFHSILIFLSQSAFCIYLYTFALYFEIESTFGADTIKLMIKDCWHHFSALRAHPGILGYGVVLCLRKLNSQIKHQIILTLISSFSFCHGFYPRWTTCSCIRSTHYCFSSFLISMGLVHLEFSGAWQHLIECCLARPFVCCQHSVMMQGELYSFFRVTT